VDATNFALAADEKETLKKSENIFLVLRTRLVNDAEESEEGMAEEYQLG